MDEPIDATMAIQGERELRINIHYIKKLPDEELSQFIEEARDERALQERRLVALKKTQRDRPDFWNYNPIAEDYLSIDTYIEMGEAIRDEINEELALLEKEHDKRRGLDQTIRMF